MLVSLPEIITTTAPKMTKDRPIITKALTGMSLALVETLVCKPFDRLKVHLMTQKASERSVYGEFYSDLKSTKVGFVREMFRGFGPLFAR